MMPLARRGFLKAFSALPAAPLAIKDALASSGMSQTLGLGSVVGSIGSYGQSETIGENTEVKAATWLINNGVPAFVSEAIRRDYRVPSGLDPDLVSNRSFSLSAKLHMQRERDIARRIAEVPARQKMVLKRAALRKTLGFDLWW